MRKSIYAVTLLLTLSFILALSAGAGNLPIAQLPNPPISESPDLLFPESLLSPTSPDVNVIYVDASATGANDGSSWANAYTDLAVALENAPFASIIQIAEGTYTPGTQRDDSFQLKSAVYLLGGYPSGGGGLFGERFPAAHETILSGEIGGPGPEDNSYHVVTGDNAVTETALLDGVSIAHGNANDAGNNGFGAGLVLDGSQVTLQNCMIYDNFANGSGPALFARDDAEVVINNCTIAGNAGGSFGSALIIFDSELRMSRSIVRDNHAVESYGPLWLVKSNSAIINSVFVNNANDAPSGGVISVQGGTSYLNHVSVSGHNQTGLMVTQFEGEAGAGTVLNSIFWDNSAPELSVEADSELEVSDSVVQGGFSGGTNIITSNPGFIDAPNGNLTLGAFSPAIDAADLATCFEDDRQGYPRPIGAGCDMGAYETPQRNSYCSFPGLAIPDNHPSGAKDSLDVGNLGLILDVDVTINATHAAAGDLRASIKHESADILRTILNFPVDPVTALGCQRADINATFDDEGDAPADLTCSSSPPAALAGSLVPTGSLATFDNKLLSSTWTLKLIDLVGGNIGTLNSWCLNVDWMPSLTVTRADDPEPDGCKPGDCSLREAIIASNASPAIDDVITFAVDGPFVLSWPGMGEQFAATGDLDIRDSVTIVGNGTESTIIDGGALDRVFDVSVSGDAHVTFSDLTIQNGQIDPVDAVAYGGGLAVIGSGTQVDLVRTIVRDNFAIASGSGLGTAGAISNTGAVLVIQDSAIHGNNADDSGAIVNAHGDLTLANSTVYGNTGGGPVIYMDGNGSVSVYSSTIAANQGSSTLFAYANTPSETAAVFLLNSIISAPGLHCSPVEEDGGSAAITSNGHNIAGDGSCNLTEPTDMPNTDPLIGPMADNGGSSPTAALLQGSPALDGGTDFGCPPNDQRGLPRLDRDGNGDGGADNNPCDIGAYELQAAFVNTPPVADPQTVNVVKDTPKVITLTGSDADGDPLQYSVVIPPDHGLIASTIGAPVLTYTPAAGYTGPDSFTFFVYDGTAASAEATVTINVSAAPPPNTPPVANPQSLTTPMDTIKNFTLTGSDADGDPLTFQIVTNPANGNLLGQFPNIAYQPNQGFIGADSFTFRVNDGTVDSPPAMVTIQVMETSTQAFNLFLPILRR